MLNFIYTSVFQFQIVIFGINDITNNEFEATFFSII